MEQSQREIVVHIERGGESVRTVCKEGDTIQALIDQGHLRGVEVTSTRVNGAPTESTVPLSDGDSVVQVPISGRQG